MTLTQRAWLILMEKMRSTSAMFDASPTARYGILWSEAECIAMDEARYEALRPMYATMERLRRRAERLDGYCSFSP